MRDTENPTFVMRAARLGGQLMLGLIAAGPFVAGITYMWLDTRYVRQAQASSYQTISAANVERDRLERLEHDQAQLADSIRVIDERTKFMCYRSPDATREGCK